MLQVENFFFHFDKIVQEHRAAFLQYLASDEFENDLDEWTGSFSSAYQVEKKFDHIKFRNDRIKAKLHHLSEKLQGTMLEGALRGAKASLVTMDVSIILGSTAASALAHLMFAMRFGGSIFLKRFLMRINLKVPGTLSPT